MSRKHDLVLQAKHELIRRGHVIEEFVHRGHPSHIATYRCRHCDAGVVVNTKPMKNDVELRGAALNVHCVVQQRITAGLTT